MFEQVYTPVAGNLWLSALVAVILGFGFLYNYSA
jgi:hypothetical protein